MPLPESASTGVLTGEFVVGPAGTPDSGTVTFTAWPVHVTVDGVTITIPPVVATLDEDGTFSVELLATDDPDVDPQGLSYRVAFALGSGPRTAAWCSVRGGETTDLEDAILHLPPAVLGSWARGLSVETVLTLPADGDDDPHTLYLQVPTL